MADTERERLYRATLEAFRKARLVFDKNPQPRSPEWDEWQRLFAEAVEATAEYTRYADDQFSRYGHHGPPGSN